MALPRHITHLLSSPSLTLLLTISSSPSLLVQILTVPCRLFPTSAARDGAWRWAAHDCCTSPTFTRHKDWRPRAWLLRFMPCLHNFKHLSSSCAACSHTPALLAHPAPATSPPLMLWPALVCAYLACAFFYALAALTFTAIWTACIPYAPCRGRCRKHC